MVQQNNNPGRRFVSRIRIAALAALYAGVSTWAGVQADDTQIYGAELPVAQTPNVLFSIDTSGSMDSSVPNSSQTRMEAVKDALTGLINNTSDLKAGLGRFHYELGGPIIFPVVNLDEAPDFLNDTQTVSSIDRSSDDAEENAGAVTLDSSALELTQINAPGETNIVSVDLQPTQSSDDDEDGTGSNYSSDSPDIDLGERDAGIRFPATGIPRNAVILHAEIEFRARTGSSGNTDAIIHGHDVDDSPTFTDTSGSASVAARFSELTNASMPWSNVVPVSAGDTVTTPNIRSVVQEIVSRGGWSDTSAMTIMLEGRGGQRELASFDGGDAPILRVQYVETATVVERQVDHSRRDANETAGGSLQSGFMGMYLLSDQTNFNNAFSHAGFIFRDIDIPDDAVVVWADIGFTTRMELTSGASDMEIHGITNPGLNGFNNGNRISEQPLTTAKADWIAGPNQGDEEIFAPADEEPMLTPNLADLVEEMRGDPSFQAGDNVGFAITDTSGGGLNERHMCSFDGVNNANACPEANSARPTLRTVYAFPGTGTTTHQQVGLRFNNVRVPQGAAIESAHLEFTVDGQSTDPGTLTIEIENNSAPKTYSNNTGEKISDRTYGASTTWNTGVWDTIGETRQSPDLSALVSSVTGQSGWCGGGSLAFRITSSDARLIAQAWDKGGSGAPSLRVEYDTDNLGTGEGCTTRQASVSIDSEENDVEESTSGSRNMSLFSDDLDLDDNWLVGLRFENIPVPAGATVTSTNLYLTGDGFDSGDTSVSIQAQQHPNAPPFTSASSNVSNRVGAGDPSVTWNITDSWNEDVVVSTQDDGVDLTSLIAGIVDGSVVVDGEQWASGNAMVFVLDGQNPNRRAEVCCGSDPPSRLEIFYEVNLGDVGDDGGLVTGREAILSIVDDIIASGWTPTVDAYYEAGAYFDGSDVHFGRTRGAGQSYEASGETQDSDLDWRVDGDWDSQLLREGELSRLSHHATYDPQTAPIVREGACTASDPNNPDCRTEHIDNAATPRYVSPFENAEACEKGFLVLLSDGIANRNSSRALIQNLTGSNSCPLQIPQIDDAGEAILTGNGDFSMRDPISAEQCGLELADYLHETDFITDGNDPGDVTNNVRTFTIGFNLDITQSTENKQAVEFLKALAFVGSGGNLDDPDGVEGVRYGDGFYTANTASELQTAFEVIVGEINKETSSFVAPGISINAVNRLHHLNDIYYSLFRPDDTVAWLGNLKKFQLCQAGQNGCEFGEVVDKNGNPAVNTDFSDQNTFGTLKSGAQGIWSGADDSAPEIDEGGAGERIPTYTERNVYVNTDGTAVVPPDYSGATPVQGTSVHKINLAADVGDPPASGDPADFDDLKAALYERNNCNDPNDMDGKNACLNDLIEWLTGKKFPGDRPRDGTDEDEDRWAFGDPMHSRPLILTYGIDEGADADSPADDIALSKVFVGTNDGGIRMINDGDGVEEWIYYPYSMLTWQSALKENPGGSHRYGVDGTPTVRVNDEDNDFIIEPADGDFIHLYIGMRRGGKELIALNVTPDDTVDGETVNGQTVGEKGLVEPEVLWRISPTDDLDFQRLGDTWSTPRPVRIQDNSGSRTVLIFGGGYNPDKQDGTDTDGTTPDGGDAYNSSTSGDSQGNAIFVVDAETGERLWWASSDGDADAVVPAMNTSIAAPVTPVDTNQDGHMDRIYAVDMRGQVFRVDIDAAEPTGDESVLAPSSVGVLATLGPDEDSIPDGEQAPNEDRRKFFYAPEVARVNDTLLVGQPYELIGIVSGNRSNPQGKTVLDRAYALRDFLTENPSSGLDGSTFPKCNPRPEIDCPTTAITHSHLSDVTDKENFVIREEQDDGALILTDADGNEPTVLDDLQQSHGWFFDLEGEHFNAVEEPDDPTTGEKGFSAATVLDGKMFFTSYLPPEDVANLEDVCSVPGTLGTSRFYAIDFFTGAPAFIRNPEDSGFEKAHRFTDIGAGPSSDVTVVNTPGKAILQVPTRQGSTMEDPDFAPSFNKTFWLEER